MLRRTTLHVGQQVAVEAQLEDVLGVGLTLQLGVYDFVGPFAELGRRLYLLQEVRIASPYAVEHRSLKNHIRPGAHRLQR